MLLAPTLSCLRKALSIISNEARILNLKFNPTKSVFVHFTKHRRSNNQVAFNNVNHKFQPSVKYLGVTLEYNLSDKIQLTNLRTSLIYSANNVLQSLNFARCETRCKVINSKCTSFYGSEVLYLNNLDKVCTLETAWNKIIRRVYRLPYRTHRYLIPFLSGSPYLKFLLARRILNFSIAFKNSNLATSFLFNFFSLNSQSFIGNNIWSCRRFLSDIPEVTIEQFSLSSVLFDLIGVREGGLVIPGFTKEDIEHAIQNICIG